MKILAKMLLILVVATLPLRGVAAAWGPAHEASTEAVVAHEGCHEAQQQGEDGEPALEASCGHCAACPVGAPALPVSLSALSSVVPGSLSIPFLDRRVRAYVPERLDRPPLAL